MREPQDAAQEREWLARAQHQRDTKAFGKLVDLHHARIQAVLRRLTHGNHALAEELAQEALWKAWNALPGFRADARFSTWLHRIAYHEFLQYQRRSAHAGSMVQVELQEQASGPADAADNEALRIDLQRALNSLKPAEMAAIVHCYYGDLSHAEAALVLGMPLGTVKSLVLRGSEKLRLSLAAWKTPQAEKDDPHG